MMNITRIDFRKAAGFVGWWLSQPRAPRRICMAGWDDDDALAEDFAEHFNLPTMPHHAWELVVQRLRRLLKRMWEERLLDRWTLGNNPALHDEPRWQFAYEIRSSPYGWFAAEIRRVGESP